MGIFDRGGPLFRRMKNRPPLQKQKPESTPRIRVKSRSQASFVFSVVQYIGCVPCEYKRTYTDSGMRPSIGSPISVFLCIRLQKKPNSYFLIANSYSPRSRLRYCKGG
jgi:hypothetical protein